MQGLLRRRPDGRRIQRQRAHPSGVDTGTKLRSSGNGSAGRRGAQAGDLYVYITVQEHELFERDGDDLACSVPVKFSVAALGGKIVVPKLKGKTNLNIPAGTQGGTTFRLRGEGMPRSAVRPPATSSCASTSTCRRR